MSIKTLSTYLLYQLKVENAVLKVDVWEFHPVDNGAEVQSFLLNLDMSGKLQVSKKGELATFPVKKARSLYRKLTREGYKVSSKTIKDFAAGLVSHTRNS